MTSPVDYYLFFRAIPGGILAPTIRATDLEDAKRKASEFLHHVMSPDDGLPGYGVEWSFLMRCDLLDPKVVHVKKRLAEEEKGQ